MRIGVVMAVTLCVVAGGCATIIRGDKTDFKVTSTPSGAMVELSTGETCEATPCTFRRARKVGFTATVSLEGYQNQTVEVGHHWSRHGTTTGVVGNAILGGGIGIGIDAATGANQDLFPNPLNVTLVPVAPPPAAVEAATPVATPTVTSTP